MELKIQIVIQAHTFEAACAALAKHTQQDPKLVEQQLRTCVAVELDSGVWLQQAGK